MWPRVCKSVREGEGWEEISKGARGQVVFLRPCKRSKFYPDYQKLMGMCRGEAGSDSVSRM